MDHKEIVYKACSDLYEKYRSPESDNIIEIVKERAKNMDNNEKSTNTRKLVEITVPRVEPRKSKGPLIAGIVGISLAAAGLGFFAGRLPGIGGIDITSQGAASHSAGEQNTGVWTTVKFLDPSVNSGIVHEETEPTLYRFRDFDVRIDHFDFDGQIMNAHYWVEYHDEIPEEALGDTRGVTVTNSAAEPEPSIENGSGMEVISFARSVNGNGIHYDTAVRFKDNTPIAEIRLINSENPEEYTEIINVAADDEDVVAVTTAVYVTSEEYTTAITETADSTEETTVTAVLPDTAGIIETDEYSNGKWFDFSDMSVSVLSAEYDGRIARVDVEVKGNDGRDPELYLVRNSHYESPYPGYDEITHRINVNDICFQNKDGTYTLCMLCDIPNAESEQLILKHLPFTFTGGSGSPLEDGPTFMIRSYYNENIRYDDNVVDMTAYGIPGVKMDKVIMSPFGLELHFTSEEQVRIDSTVLKTTLTYPPDRVVNLGVTNTTANVPDENGLYHTCVNYFVDKTTDLPWASSISINGYNIAPYDLENEAVSVLTTEDLKGKKALSEYISQQIAANRDESDQIKKELDYYKSLSESYQDELDMIKASGDAEEKAAEYEKKIRECEEKIGTFSTKLNEYSEKIAELEQKLQEAGE